MDEFVAAQALPDVFDWIEFRCVWRQHQERDVAGHDEISALVPASTVQDENGVGPRRHGSSEFGQVHVETFGVGARHHQARADAALRTDGTEQVGRGVARVLHGARARASARPDVGQRALLADPGLVLEPDLKRLAAGFLRDHLRDPRGEGFLKSAWAAASQFG